MDVALDGLHVLGVLFLRVGVVEAEVAGAAEALGCSEVHDEGLGVADVQVAVRLGREAGVEASAVAALLEVALDFLLYEVEALGGLLACGPGVECLFCHSNYVSKCKGTKN